MGLPCWGRHGQHWSPPQLLAHLLLMLLPEPVDVSLDSLATFYFTQDYPLQVTVT